MDLLVFKLYIGEALAMGADTTPNQQRRRCRRSLIDSAKEQEQPQRKKSKPITLPPIKTIKRGNATFQYVMWKTTINL